jgi:hypothetical protein
MKVRSNCLQGGGPRTATLRCKSLSFRKVVLERKATLGCKMFFILEGGRGAIILGFKKRFSFSTSQITKVRATWKVTYLGAKVFFILQGWP